MSALTSSQHVTANAGVGTRVACGNNNISRSYLSTQPSRARGPSIAEILGGRLTPSSPGMPSAAAPSPAPTVDAAARALQAVGRAAKGAALTAGIAAVVAGAASGLAPVDGQPPIIEQAKTTSPTRGLLGAVQEVLDESLGDGTGRLAGRYSGESLPPTEPEYGDHRPPPPQ